jgi:ferredoxin
MTKVDKTKCIGCGLCASICPSVFEMKEGKASVKSQDKKECVNKAEESCPTKAISK